MLPRLCKGGFQPWKGTRVPPLEGLKGPRLGSFVPQAQVVAGGFEQGVFSTWRREKTGWPGGARWPCGAGPCGIGASGLGAGLPAPRRCGNVELQAGGLGSSAGHPDFAQGCGAWQRRGRPGAWTRQSRRPLTRLDASLELCLRAGWHSAASPRPPPLRNGTSGFVSENK